MRFFPGATSLLKGATFIDFWFSKNFSRIFNFLFIWLCIKESDYLLFKRGLRLFKGLCLLFLPNVPGAMFIQGGTFIPDSRVSALNEHNLTFEYISVTFIKYLCSCCQRYSVRSFDSCNKLCRLDLLLRPWHDAVFFLMEKAKNQRPLKELSNWSHFNKNIIRYL